MKLAKIREGLVREMSIAHGIHSSYWHGTTGEYGRKIARDGKLKPFDVVDPSRTKSRSGLMPQKGKVYLGDFQVGLANALFRGKMRDGKGEGAIVEVDAAKMGAYAPDEDEIADTIQDYMLDYTISLYHQDVKDIPVVKSFREKKKVYEITRDDLDKIPVDVATAIMKALPIKNPKTYALGEKIIDRYVDGDSRLVKRWKKAKRDYEYEDFTWLGKKILAKIKDGDTIMDEIISISTRAAHDGEVPVKRVLVFPTKDLPNHWEKEDLAKITVKDIEKIAEELRP